MKRYLPSSSKIGLAQLCGFAWSPHAPRWPAQVYSGFAAKGKAAHAVVEKLLSGETYDVYKEVAAAGVEGKAGVRSAVATAEVAAKHYAALKETTDQWDVERPIAFDVYTGKARYLAGNRAGRAYGQRGPNEITGALDQAAIFSDHIVVYDLKTGQPERKGAAADSPQLKFYALCLSRIHGLPVRVCYNHADDDGVTPDEADMSEAELGRFAESLREMVNGLATAVPKPGHHCTSNYCPLLSECPATKKALAQIDAAADYMQPFNVAIQGPEHAASVRVRLGMVKAATVAIDERLKAWSRANGPIEVAPSMMWGARDETRSTVDISHPGAYALLVKFLGGKADQAVELDTSRAAIERVAGNKKLVAELFAELENIGAMRHSTYSKMTEWRKK